MTVPPTRAARTAAAEFLRDGGKRATWSPFPSQAAALAERKGFVPLRAGTLQISQLQVLSLSYGVS